MRHVIPKPIKQAIRDGYAWPGGYPLFILCHDGGCICTKCAKAEFHQIAHSTVKGIRDDWNAIAAAVNWEDSHMECEHCGERIESAYAD